MCGSTYAILSPDMIARSICAVSSRSTSARSYLLSRNAGTDGRKYPTLSTSDGTAALPRTGPHR